MRGADFGQVCMAGKAVFGFACQRGNQFNRLGLARVPPPDEEEGQEEKEGEEENEAAHYGRTNDDGRILVYFSTCL